MLNFGNKEFRNLQEQVLQNARDIAALKGIKNLQVVIVEELPEVGNPSYIYLVARDSGEEPDVYEEYIWLEDEERYEQIGGVTIDLTNYVTVDSEQTISGAKTFSAGISTASVSSAAGLGLSSESGIETKGNIVPKTTNTNDIGSSDKKYKDLYLSGNAYLDDNKEIQFAAYAGAGKHFYIRSKSNAFHLGAVAVATNLVLDSYLISFIPEGSTQDLGNSTHYWRDFYITGYLKDGVHTISLSDISTKTTSAYQSGTFDSNGESTILDGASISEGLYIFTYGNCECFVRLTATMIQSSDVTPIRVACPMIVSGSPSLGWLHIAKSGSNLTISVKDSNDHVDSGFAWTLTKTNLL